MKRSSLGLSDIERRMADDQRRVQNAIKALLLVVLVAEFLNLITQ